VASAARDDLEASAALDRLVASAARDDLEASAALDRLVASEVFGGPEASAEVDEFEMCIGPPSATRSLTRGCSYISTIFADVYPD
jgi:hypothetical protein